MSLLNIFSVRKNLSGQKIEASVMAAENDTDEEYQLPSLHRAPFPMTDEVIRRREEEQLRKRYNLPPQKDGVYL